MFSLFGDSDFTARLAPALMGTSMVAMPYFLRNQLGRVAAFTAAVLLAIGPSYLYFSRFAREDIYFAAISFALLVVVFRFLDRPRFWHPPAIGALIALGFATKETMYITGFVAFTFFALLFWRERGGAGDTWLRVKSVGWESWVWALAAFAIVFTLMFTVFLTNPSGLWDGLHDSIAYWLEPARRGPRRGEAVLLRRSSCSAQEWPVLLLGLLGVVLAFRQPTVLRAFLVWAFALSLAIYSWAGEKFAWLVLHPLLPLILLAGLGVQWLWDARRSTLGKAGLAVAAVIALYVPISSWWLNVDHRANPRELLVSTQSSEEVKRIELEVKRDGEEGPEAVDHGRLRRRRDVPLRLVLPRPQRRLPRHDHGQPAARLRRAGDDRGRPRAAAAGAGRLHGPQVPLPRLVGARLQQDVDRQLVALVHPAQAVEPDRRPRRVPLHAPRHHRERGAEALDGRDAAAGLDRVLRRAGAGHRAGVGHDDHEAPEARRVARRARRPRGCRGRGAGTPSARRGGGGRGRRPAARRRCGRASR